MATTTKLTLHKVTALPEVLEPDALYYVKGAGDEAAAAYITDSQGNGLPTTSDTQTVTYAATDPVDGPKPLLVRPFIGSMVSDGLGNWTMDISGAGFTTPPKHVSATALGTAGAAASNQVIATVYADNMTATSVSGRTVQGTNVSLGGPSLVPAASTPITVMAWG